MDALVTRTRGDGMKLLTLASQAFLAVTVFAQAPQGGLTVDIETPIIKTSVTNIVAPVLVTDQSGNIVDGLQPHQFRLFDNGKEQNIQVDVSYEPISLVIAIECSSRVEAILPQIRHLGSLVQSIIGIQGEAAVLKFDGRIMVTQDFTNDPDKVKLAINRIQPGSSGSRMIDAVDRGVYMLRNRPRSNRRIILVVSETRDDGSEIRLKTALMDATLQNVIIYNVDITQLAVRLTEKRPDGVAPRMDASAMRAPMGMANTPTTMEQNYGQKNRAQFVPLLKEIYIDAKGIFIKDAATQFSRATGGHEFMFLRQKGLEDAVQRIGTELHSHYMISYKPSNGAEGGYHNIEVVANRSDLICKTRPGYYIGGGQN